MVRVDDAEGQRCWITVPLGSLIVLQVFFLKHRLWLPLFQVITGRVFLLSRNMFCRTWNVQLPQPWVPPKHEDMRLVSCLMPPWWTKAQNWRKTNAHTPPATCAVSSKTFCSDLRSDVSTSIHVSRSWHVCSHTMSKSLPLSSSS